MDFFIKLIGINMSKTIIKLFMLVLKQLSIFCLFTSVLIRLFFFFSSRRRHTRSTRDWSSDVCSSDLLFRETARRAFRFFIEESDPKTGLTKDRSHLNGGDDYAVASIAATGYALTALPIGVENGWISRGEARRRALVT